MDSGHKYRPLDRSKNEIRLLKLLPSTGNLKLLPQCYTSHAALQENPKFTALSYVWGDASDRRLVLVDDFPVSVTKNLYDAIMALRLAKEPIIIWIDSLCVNQLDDEEKSWQVALMSKIYRQAEQVVAWLGLADEDSESVIDYLNMCGAKAVACGLYQGGMPGYDISNKTTPTDKQQSRENIHKLLYALSGWHGQNELYPIAGLKRFFGRPWWGRVWVLQEITFAESAEFLCGTKRLSRLRCTAAFNAWNTLYWGLVRILFTNPGSMNSILCDIVEATPDTRAQNMLFFWTTEGRKFPLASLLYTTCAPGVFSHRDGPLYLESSDPRDKIFALLVLAIDCEELKAFGVTPDYSQSCRDVYTATMAALLQQGHISMLSMCQTTKLQPGLPSWVPDWSRPAKNMLQVMSYDLVTCYPVFSASGAEARHPRATTIKRIGDTMLSLKGYVYDEVCKVRDIPRWFSSCDAPIVETYKIPSRWLIEILRLTYYGKQRTLDFSSRLRAAARISIGDAGLDGAVDLARVEDIRFLEAVDLLRVAVDEIKEDHIKLELQKLLGNRHIKTALRCLRPVNRLGAEIAQNSWERLPFISKKGHLAIGSDSVRRGDFIALIAGAQLPFILRYESDGKHQLIGEAYVDGIMHGEAMENSEWADITLV